jgi:leader peptidase (prepilin peptidase)/N-methyltransferase
MVVVFGLAAAALLPVRWSETRDLLLVGLYLATLTVLLATDLDQRILPDALTLPLIPIALAVLLFDWDPLLANKDLGLVSGLAASLVFPALLYAGSAILHGGLGLGDVKLLVGVGLVSGVSRLLGGLLAASLGFGAVLAVLVIGRRIGLRSFVPFGPVIIVAAAVAALAP